MEVEKINSVTVLNLSTGSEQIYDCSPKEAVRAAHAQSLGDWNTWEYSKYDKLVVDRGFIVACGDFSALIK